MFVIKIGPILMCCYGGFALRSIRSISITIT